VNFESISLEGEGPEIGIDLTGGSFNTLRTAGEVKSGRLSNGMAVYSRFTRTLSDGYKFNSGSDSYSFFFSGGYLGSRHVVKVNAFAGKTQNDQSYLPVLRADIDSEPRTNYNSPNDTDDFEQELLQVQYTGLLRDNLILNSSLYYGGSRGVFPFGLSPTNQLLFGLENDHFGVMSDLSYKSGNLDLKGGFHTYTFLRENINSTAPNTSNPDYEDETTKNEFSSFIRASYDFGKLNVFGDLQLRYVDLAFDTDQIQSFGGAVPAGGLKSSRNWLFLNPRVGARYSLNPNSSVYASLGATGREPTRTDILQGDGSSINEFNFFSAQDVDIVVSEHVIDYELGYNFSRGRLLADVNLFWMDFKNEISLVGALAANSYIPLRQNINESYRRGVEWVLDYSPNNQWNVNLNGAWMQTNVDRFVNGTGEVFTDVEHIFAPDWNLNASLQYAPVERIGMTLRARYLSESYMELSNDEDFRLPEVFFMDAQLDLNLSEQLRLSLFLNNIFDELYFTDGAPVDVDFDGNIDGPGFRVQPPRNAFVQLRFNL
jgi:iron complex outermembrane receptor protein